MEMINSYYNCLLRNLLFNKMNSFQCFKVEAIDIHLLFNRGKLISQVKECSRKKLRGEDIPKLFSHPKVGKYFWQVN